MRAERERGTGCEGVRAGVRGAGLRPRLGRQLGLPAEGQARPPATMRSWRRAMALSHLCYFASSSGASFDCLLLIPGSGVTDVLAPRCTKETRHRRHISTLIDGTFAHTPVVFFYITEWYCDAATSKHPDKHITERVAMKYTFSLSRDAR